jgi:TIR domain
MDRNTSAGECKKFKKLNLKLKLIICVLLLLGIPDVVSKNIKDSKRFVLILSKNVTTDPTCIYACAVAIEEAISGQHNLKQLISIYPWDKKKVCSSLSHQIN